MNSQPTSIYPNSHPDACIAQVLDALRTTGPPTGLEQRIAARLAQATEARTQTVTGRSPASSFFAVILSGVKDPRILLAAARHYTVASTALALLLALTTITILHQRTPVDTNRPTYAQSRVPHLRDGIIVAKVGIAPSATALSSLEGAGRQPRQTAPATNPSLAEEASSPLPPSAQDLPSSAQDPETIALAETIAPSRPASPMPLTAQEKLIQAATRPGQPIQLAELDLARAPSLHAEAEARQTASIDRYIRSLLAPLAVADALQPTTLSQPQEAPTAAPAEPTSNPSN